jgi:hypothetical protein
MRMPSFATLLMALLVAQYAYAKTDQPCISKATEALPHIAGLVVKKRGRVPVRLTFWPHGGARPGPSLWTWISSPRAG